MPLPLPLPRPPLVNLIRPLLHQQHPYADGVPLWNPNAHLQHHFFFFQTHSVIDRLSNLPYLNLFYPTPNSRVNSASYCQQCQQCQGLFLAGCRRTPGAVSSCPDSQSTALSTLIFAPPLARQGRSAFWSRVVVVSHFTPGPRKQLQLYRRSRDSTPHLPSISRVWLSSFAARSLIPFFLHLPTFDASLPCRNSPANPRL